jgi:quercetin dioxygenase-like cupin family protein
MSDYSIVKAIEAEDAYADSDVPGEFRSLSDALGAEQLAVTLIRIPPHSDFEQGSGHRHEEIEEVYLVTHGTLTMCFGEEVETVEAGSAVRVAPRTVRSHRNEGDEAVEMWAISSASEDGGEKVDDFWEASPEATSIAEAVAQESAAPAKISSTVKICEQGTPSPFARRFKVSWVGLLLPFSNREISVASIPLFAASSRWFRFLVSRRNRTAFPREERGVFKAELKVPPIELSLSPDWNREELKSWFGVPQNVLNA